MMLLFINLCNKRNMTNTSREIDNTENESWLANC
jgi:hypothetical protein